MAQRLRGLVLDRVDLVDRGANPGAFIRLVKRDDPLTVPAGTTANSASVAFVHKAVAAYPTLPRAVAIGKYAETHPDEYRHASGQTAAGTSRPYTPPAAVIVPMMKRETASAAIMRTADVLFRSGTVSKAEAVSLAAHLRPDLYSITAGHPTVRKAGPPSEQELEQSILNWYLNARDPMRRAADRKAAQVSAMQMSSTIAELLNIWEQEGR